jgi:hypothetical protein
MDGARSRALILGAARCRQSRTLVAQPGQACSVASALKANGAQPMNLDHAFVGKSARLPGSSLRTARPHGMTAMGPGQCGVVHYTSR